MASTDAHSTTIASIKISIFALTKNVLRQNRICCSQILGNITA